MFWDVPGDDMDLHLIRGDKTWEEIKRFDIKDKERTFYDCGFSTCTAKALAKLGLSPDWGTLSDPIDDPKLDLDDELSTGPENINIMACTRSLLGWCP